MDKAIEEIKQFNLEAGELIEGLTSLPTWSVRWIREDERDD